MSGFKRFVAGVADDIRHKVVEEGWYGKQTTGNIYEPNMPDAAEASAIHAEPVSDFYDSTRTDQPTAHDLYGNLPGMADVKASDIDGFTPNAMTATEIEVPNVPDNSPSIEHQI